MHCSYFKTVAKATLPAKTQFLRLESFDKYHICIIQKTKKKLNFFPFKLLTVRSPYLKETNLLRNYQIVMDHRVTSGFEISRQLVTNFPELRCLLVGTTLSINKAFRKKVFP